MKNPVNEMKQRIQELLLESYRACAAEGLLPETELAPFDIEQPREVQNGDFSSNIAMKNVRILKKAPQMIGQQLLEGVDPLLVAEVHRAGAGDVDADVGPFFVIIRREGVVVVERMLNRGPQPEEDL